MSYVYIGMGGMGRDASIQQMTKKTLPGLKYVFSYPRIHNSIRYTWYVFLMND